ncbi:fibulin-2 [Lampris incognitus]|uniref:fibulin-2 n=1 Tax=Lampris incognitus TaxID=2546036 RepID=UPI0024B51520|nr:fibulin-2 [Lampris incognitus]
MACLLRAEMTLLKCALLSLFLSGCLCQRDCTGVDCPLLNNCIEEVLESGACCASCIQTGCTCEGYQYYDCVNAGFKNGKVPEGESYFVDYGSTECWCPEGGGRISCNFISCPDIPVNCIEVIEPTDGCMQCERIGCVHGGQKYDAGHSFQMDPCQVCHCPSDGGKLMCYPVPDCDPVDAHKPTLARPTEENTASQRHSDLYGFDQQGYEDHISTTYRLSPSGNLPLFKTPPLDKQELEDYDYGPTDMPEPYPETLAFSTQSSASNKVKTVSHTSDRADRGKLELRQRYGVREHIADKMERIDVKPVMKEQSTARPSLQEATTTAWKRTSQVAARVQNASESDTHTLQPLLTSESHIHHSQAPSENPMHARSSSDGVRFPLHRGSGSEKHQLYPDKSIENLTHSQQTIESSTGTQKASESQMLQIQPPKVSESQMHPLQPAISTVSQTHPKKGSDEKILPQYPLRNSETSVHLEESSKGLMQSQTTVVPQLQYTDEEEADEEEVEENKELEQEEEERIVSLKNVDGPEGSDVPYYVSTAEKERIKPGGYGESRGSSDPGSNYEKTTVEPGTKSPESHETQTTPTVHLVTTSQPPLRVKTDGSQPGKKEPQTLFTLPSEESGKAEEEVAGQEERKGSSVFLLKPVGGSVPGPGDSAEQLVDSCCVFGQKWAIDNNNCDAIPPRNNDKHFMCSVVQKQCCLSSLKESRCAAGMTSARRGDVCEADTEDQCTDDSYQVCCSCCALGLRLRSEGRGCDAHQYLGYPCGHVLLTCCEEDGYLSQPSLRRKEKPRPTAMPKKVLDKKFPKEAFSIDAIDEAANAVEEQEDVDECQLYLGQLCQHTCTNTRVSYRCGCHPGYVLQQDEHSCAPVSPEEDNRVKEEDIPAMVPTSATTTTTRTSSPVQLRLCAGNGPCSQQCAVVEGQARCSCFPGFRLMADRRTCEDVNECVTNTHSCRPDERCVNTVGSFVCEQHVTCPPGYQLRGGVCDDIDECVVRSGNCGIGFECENTEGSFLCKPKQNCLTGFTQDSHGNCIDINECSSLSEPCRSGFNCVNTVGSYTCQRKMVMCNPGYHPSSDGAKCVDMDECHTGSHRCGAGQICHNLPGSYRCDCQTGYQYDVTRQVCTDVNECWRYPGRLCAQTCENTPGSYQCSCTAGFSLAFDGKNCEDVNECERNPCSQECANVYGSYQCYCRQGFYLKEDGHTCEDIDECSQSIGNLCAFQCVNVPGSYQCACPLHGYTMSTNGRTCKDIDECTTGSHNCSYGQTCYNIQGAFRCLSFDCPPNYKKVSDIRCERLSCPSNSLDCHNSPLRITYYQLSFQTNIVIPAQIFRIGPSPAYSGDHIVISITKGNEEGYFSTRKLNSFTGAVYLQRHVREPKDFLVDVEMKLLRQGTFTSFLARIYVFITASSM